VLPLKVDYTQSFVRGVRQIEPKLSFPLGEEPIVLGDGAIEIYSALASLRAAAATSSPGAPRTVTS
jgi:phosphate transport system permease protein